MLEVKAWGSLLTERGVAYRATDRKHRGTATSTNPANPTGPINPSGLSSALGLSPHYANAPKAKVDEFGSLLAREAAAGQGRMYGHNGGAPGAAGASPAGGMAGGGGLHDNVVRLAGVARRASTVQIGIVVTGVLMLFVYSKIASMAAPA